MRSSPRSPTTGGPPCHWRPSLRPRLPFHQALAELPTPLDKRCVRNPFETQCLQIRPGELVRLEDRIASGPVVVVFYRGGWCPYCNLHLAELNRSLDEIRALGASLIAITPQRPDDSLSFAEKLDLGFDVLSDPGQQVIRSYHLQFRLPDVLHDLYRQMGMGLEEQNADGSWNLPVPATFVVDRGGIIAARHVDPDYKERMSASAVLEALQALL